MEVSRGHIVLIVLCLLVGLALLYAGTLGGLGLMWIGAGGYFVIIATGVGLRVMGRLLEGRAAQLLTGRFVGKVVFWSMAGLMLLLIVMAALDGGR
jgi:hypothetical protein